jgi:glycosyltransferase involved in cell wall biosynthesis
MTLDVLLVQPGFGERGGVTVDVLNLADGLTRSGHRARTAGSLKQLISELRSPAPAVVHVFGCLPSPTIFGAIALARVRGLPLVWTPIFNPIRRQTWRGYRLLRAMEAFDAVAPHAARLADAVIAATPPEAEYFAAIAPRRVELIPPGVDAPELAASAAEIANFRRKMGAAASGPLVLTVARDNSRKGLPFGLEAFSALRARVPTVQLLLVGPNRGFAGAGTAGVVCPGWLDGPEIALAYQAADVLFVPSLYEGLPRAVIEAWRWCTPVVATERVALASTIEGVGGRVTPYGKPDLAAVALLELLKDSSARQLMGSAGQQLAGTTFLMPRLVERTLALYLDIASTHSEPCQQ